LNIPILTPYYRHILPGTIPRGADRFRDGCHNRSGRLWQGRFGVSEARQKPIICDEETEKTTNSGHAATGTRVQ